jgi:hypothetical protein
LKKAATEGTRIRLDREWPAEMEKALRLFQPRCVNCGAPDDLTTHHVRPVSRGHGLRLGNAVRLCRSCNSFIHDRGVAALTPEMARRLRDAAASFLAYWKSGCVAAEVFVPAPLDDLPKAPDPALVALLAAVQAGDGDSILALASWLEGRGDPRAATVRDVAGLEAELRELPSARRVFYEVRYTRRGKAAGSSMYFSQMAGEADFSPDQRLKELLVFRRVEEVRERLGLSSALWYALVSYLGLGPDRAASSIEEIARRGRTQVQTVRSRIDLALHNLGDPSAAVRRAEQQRGRRSLIEGKSSAEPVNRNAISRSPPSDRPVP